MMVTTGNTEVNNDGIKQEEGGVFVQERSLQETIFKLQKKRRKTKDKLKMEIIKVRTLEKEVEDLRSKLMVYQIREQEKVVNDKMEVEPLGGGEEECEGDRWEEWEGDGWEEVCEEKTKISYKAAVDKPAVGNRSKKQPRCEIALNLKVLTSQKRSSETKQTIPEKRKKTEDIKAGVKREFWCGEEGCGAKFKRRSLLENHGRSKHGKAKLSCHEPDCGKEYFSQDSLQRHVSNDHKKIRPFNCKEEACDRKFACERQLRNHGRAEHNHSKLRCQNMACNRLFISYFGLYKHMRKEHK